MLLFARKITLLIALTSLAACKLQVMVPEGGEVQSIASNTCLAQTVCVHEIEDTSYSETFTAVPEEGWDFLRWNSGGDFLCADSTSLTCVVSNIPLAGNPIIEAIVASTQSYYIQPVFQQRNEAITDFLTVIGYEIPQPDLFTNLSWSDIAIICPLWNNGICDGILNGYDMTGWTWMDWPTMNAVFNAYGTTPPLPLVPPNISGANEVNSAWAPAFFAAGWRPTSFPSFPLFPASGTMTEGWLRSEPLTPGFGSIGRMIDYDPVVNSDTATSGWNLQKSFALSTLGAWFYRVSPP